MFVWVGEIQLMRAARAALFVVVRQYYSDAKGYWQLADQSAGVLATT
jgi:hypothetical protein